MKHQYIITALATALIASFGFSSYQEFVVIEKLQQEKVDIKMMLDADKIDPRAGRLKMP